eukprot:gene8564-17669_t
MSSFSHTPFYTDPTTLLQRNIASVLVIDSPNRLKGRPRVSLYSRAFGTDPIVVDMVKGKPAMSSTRFQNLLRYFCIVSVLIIGIYFIVPMEFPFEIVQNILGTSKRGSAIYTPKVLPADTDDDALDKLPPSSFSYLTMIDAGSSGCRAHVYRYGLLGSSSGPLYIVPKHVSKKVKPGLSSFASNPTAAGESLLGLIEFLKTEIPQSEWPNTPIWLKATAGLRMINVEQSSSILQSVRQFLSDKSKSPFLFRPSWAKVISGAEEGAFGWIAVNYLYKVIGPKKNIAIDPYAVVEMGGASSQVTQMAPALKDAEEIPSEYRYSFVLNNIKYVLYTHSYLGYGGEQARETINKILLPKDKSNIPQSIQDPCLNNGYIRNKSEPRKEVYEGPNINLDILGHSKIDPHSCFKLATDALFPKSDSSCRTPPPYSFSCIHQPNFIKDTKNFLVFENFYYVASGVGLQAAGHTTTTAIQTFPLQTNPQEYIDSYIEVCSHEWSQLQVEYPKDKQPKDVLTKLCFGASYAAAFLLNGLSLPADKVITVQREVAGSEIEWALGAAYKEASDYFLRDNQNLRTTRYL